ncbi:HAD family hydrolase [Rhodovulum sp. DZ06]|uniref:sulfotransferase-like domain-containing protein n=1 Tax=Rhodovulum sp. DZ06 TaxID=3425126 RepID=UPI003D333E24
MRIACWSGPRNLSTAMMYAFAARGDCAVTDEPFYAAYLDRTGLAHPMAEEIMAAQDRDPGKVAAAMAGPIPGGRPLWYQKHMCQHMLEGVDRSWFDACTHVFLLRHPARVLASYAAKREAPGAEDIGFRLQAEIFDEVRARGLPHAVIDSHVIREAPEAALRALCAAIGVVFTPAMLSWPAGGRPEDGVWAPHWYDAVHRSTGFAGAEGALPDLPGSLRPLCDETMPHYSRLRAHALRPEAA